MSEKTNIATLDYLNEYDPAIGNAMTDELKRQRRNLELIASQKTSFLRQLWLQWAACSQTNMPRVIPERDTTAVASAVDVG